MKYLPIDINKNTYCFHATAYSIALFIVKDWEEASNELVEQEYIV
jgi:hypothetical protein